MKRLVEKLPLYHSLVRLTPSEALRLVTSKDGLGVYASSDTLFRGAVFGRDSLEVGEDLLDARPKLVKRILLTIASLQGVDFNRTNEEEAGKIVHEYRRKLVDGKPLDDHAQRIFDQLSARWDGSPTELVYYGSVDATPLFIRLVGSYCRRYGPTLLNQTVKQRDGLSVELVTIVDAALDWLLKKLQTSRSGFLEFQRLNPQGIDNQAWKDSHEFYVHENGRRANHRRPITSIEVQGLAYDALLVGAELIPSRTDELQKAAAKLQEKVLKTFWLAERAYFALGADYDARGQLRLITTTTANPAELLDSRLFDNLSVDQRQYYFSGLVPNIMGSDFLTDAGVRSRALSEARLIDFWDYHGSFTSWPKETYDIARGLRRQGFTKLAVELENRLLNVVQATKAYPEFFYIDERGRVLGMAPLKRSHGEVVYVESTNRPEKTQAWTVSAILAIQAARRRLRQPKTVELSSWQTELEKNVLTHIPHVRHLKSAKELAARYPAYPFEARRH